MHFTVTGLCLFLPMKKIFGFSMNLTCGGFLLLFFFLCFIFVCLCLCFSCFYCSLALVLPTYSFYYIKAKIEETITQARCKYCDSNFRVSLLSSSIKCLKTFRFWNTQGLSILVAVITKSTAMILTHSKHARNKKYSTRIEYEQVLPSHWQSPPPCLPRFVLIESLQCCVLCCCCFKGLLAMQNVPHSLCSWHCASKALPFLSLFLIFLLLLLARIILCSTCSTLLESIRLRWSLVLTW